MAEQSAAYNWFWKQMNSLTESRGMSPEEVKQYQADKLKEDQQKQSGIFNPLDALYHKVLATAGKCTPNIEQLNSYLEKAEQYTKYAKNTASIIDKHPSIYGKLDKAAELIGVIHEYVEKSTKVIGDIDAACQISEAIDVLNKWAANPNGDNKEASAAFDKLFGGVSKYAEKLPPPLNAYSKILSQISISHFFSHMYELGESRVGGNTSTPTGKVMKEDNDELERQARGM